MKKRQEKKIIFDTGPIITLSLNNLLWILEPLKEKANARFLITPAIKYELVDRPLKIKRFKFEAMQTMQYIRNSTLEIMKDEEAKPLAEELLEISNSILTARGKNIKIVHYAEMEAVALAITRKADAVIIDERTLRMLIEDPEKLKSIMQHRLKTKITVNRTSLNSFMQKVKGIRFLRSVELVTVAFEMKLLDRYLPRIPRARENLLDSVLWGVKLNGCSVSNREIQRIKKMEIK